MSVLREAVAVLRPPASGRHGPLPVLMIALTVVTGVVDAASYLKLGHVFVANMTGNVVFLGFAIAGASGLSIASSLIAIASFLIGAFAGGWLGARSAEHRGHVLRAASFTQLTLLAVALVLALATSEPFGTGARYALIVPLALAMGVQNAAAQRLAVPELTTTVLTKTLVGIASEGSLAGGKGAQLGRRLMAVGAMLLGALFGGLLALHVAVSSALALAVAIVLMVGLAAHALSRRDAPWIHP
jgi:uncharacterized membrane protein YoaK (UPF0700 family)